LFTIYLFYEKV